MDIFEVILNVFNVDRKYASKNPKYRWNVFLETPQPIKSLLLSYIKKCKRFFLPYYSQYICWIMILRSGGKGLYADGKGVSSMHPPPRHLLLLQLRGATLPYLPNT